MHSVARNDDIKQRTADARKFKLPVSHMKGVEKADLQIDSVNLEE